VAGAAATVADAAVVVDAAATAADAAKLPVSLSTHPKGGLRAALFFSPSAMLR
jgi:hypothetical protein